MDRAKRVLARMKGPVVPINVCFNEDGTPNYGAVGDYVNWLCDERAPILMLTGGSSEFASLSDDEIRQLTAAVAEANAGRSLFIASTGFWKPSLARDFLAHADRVGVDAVKVQFHAWLQLSRDVVIRYFDLLEGASDIPLLLLSGTQPQFPIEAAAELAQRPNVVGIKNDGHPFYDYYELIRSTRDHGFGVISGGQMRNFVFGYQIGSPAYLCPIAPFRPDIALHFYGLLVEGRLDDAWEMVFRYEDPWLKWAVSQNWLVTMKSAIQLQRLYPNNLLGPAYPHPPAESLDIVRAKLEEIFGASRTR